MPLGVEPAPSLWKLIDGVPEATHTRGMTQRFRAWAVGSGNVCLCTPRAAFENVHCSFTCRRQSENSECQQNGMDKYMVRLCSGIRSSDEKTDSRAGIVP